MKILLVNPSDQAEVYRGQFRPNYPPPLGLSYIGAALESTGHEVKIIDIDTDIIDDNAFGEITRSNYEIVGFTATTPVFKNAERLCKIVKNHTDAMTVLGGIHATLVPSECLNSPYIDVVVRGEGEVTVKELADAVSEKKDYSEVKGISFKSSGRVVHTPDRSLVPDLDALPFPARHLFQKKKYSYGDSLYLPVMPIMTSRGCPHQCTYCCSKKTFGDRVRFRSAVNVADEINHLIQTYGTQEIHIWDDNFTLNKQRVFEIRDELKKREIKTHFIFPNGLRADEVDQNILKCLKDMGAYQVAFGIESGNQSILDNAKKKIRLEQIEEAFRLAKAIGLETWGFFILGLPGETKETLQDSIDFAKKINPDIVKFHILKPFPGTTVFEQLNRKGLITTFDYSQYAVHTRPVHRLPGLSEDDLLRWSRKLYSLFYFRPSKIFSLLLRMKSWKRMKLNIELAISFGKFLKSQA